MSKSALIIATTLAACLLAGCEKPETSTSTPAASPAQETATTSDKGADEIAWHKGDVDAAFSLAKAQNKPLYLYWGAIWCPPCQEIKHTVFKSPDFLALSKLFVPVYLDGDTPQAQAQGERFGVKGYPTMIVFSPEGDEITRIPGGIDISRYNSILELSLNQMKPTADLVELAMTNPDALDAADFTQLAYYSWGQDFQVLPEDSSPDLFKDLSDLARNIDEVASARLYMEYLVASVREDGEEARIRGAVRRLTSILEDPAMVLNCWDSLAYWPEIVEILKTTPEQAAELRTLWQDKIMAARTSPTLSTAEQLAGWLPALYYHFEGTEEPLDEATATKLVADLEAADKKTTNAFARQSVVNQIRYLYQTAQMLDQAKALLLAELDKSKAPYYFMSSLGSIAEKQEQPDEAIEWYRKAFESSEGAATRFQWGANYVRALIRIKPEESGLIQSTSESLFKELAAEDEVFTGRNFRVLRSLNKQLAEWWKSAGGDELDRRFITHIETLCASQTDGSLEQENCQSLISPDTAT